VVAPTVSEDEARDTATLATGTTVTVTVADPPLPSLVAVMVLVPAARAVTRPAALIDATLVVPDVQTIDRPVRTLLFASLRMAVAWVVPPTVSDGEAIDTVIVATGARATVTVAEPVLPSLVAVMVLVPAARAVTTPSELTDATLLVPELHAMGRPVRTLLFASLSVAVAWVVAPTVMDEEARETATLATGTLLTVRAAEPLCPSLVAVMLHVPTPTEVTIPEGPTVATAALLVDQATDRPINTLLLASFRVALACVVAPT
jgi:hypothetical protein